ncbi:MAG: MurR/RpiR family transcriptional regulator [Sedimentibacter saalensis]|jgi:DNA-binding MurR/RpiR family transcriptional regulator|uniref:RpiR family transcriptional regulator n=1 Tax=Sedimentibacter saalensis TaxID=130788 RepID=A0A562J5J9_9FIRM|nr:MurR/RpiR family transcriptional regulator [Sedimentibacter saalensis]MEA5096213.1 MurR/RpiR family transcriptional regulator [Sedimentibacter saalensis]TWH78165.1 RpiR family transcriptional regulator [Sedimentibacter saalensis]
MANISFFYKKYNKLTKKQQEIYEYIISNYEDVVFLSLKELSRRANASEVSILRLCENLGFKNFIGLKEALRGNEKNNLNFKDIEYMARHSSDSKQKMKSLFKMICFLERKNVEDMIKGVEVDKIFECANELLNANDITIFGHNASKALADYLSNKLIYLRLKASSIKLEDNDAVRTALARVDSNDFIILFSFPPYHIPTVEVIKFAKMKGAKIITITNSMNSPAITEDGYNFLCKTETPFFYNSLSMPMKFIELLTSFIAIQLGEQLDKIVKEELLVSQFINENKQVSEETVNYKDYMS